MNQFLSLKEAFSLLPKNPLNAPKLVALLLQEWDSIFHSSLSTNRPSIPEQDKKILSLMKPKLNSKGQDIHCVTRSCLPALEEKSYIMEWDKANKILEMASLICAGNEIPPLPIPVNKKIISLLGDALIQKLIETCNDRLMDVIIESSLKKESPFLTLLYNSLREGGDFTLMNDIISSLYLGTGRWDRICELLSIGGDRVSEVVFLECFQVSGSEDCSSKFDYGKVEKLILEKFSSHPNLKPLPKNAVNALEYLFGLKKGIDGIRFSTPSVVPRSLIDGLRKYNKKICQE